MQKQKSRLWDYKITGIIGKGSFGIVYKVRHIRTRVQFALKKINIAGVSQRQKVDHFRQVRMLQKIEHIQIIRLFQSFIILELVQGGDLNKIILDRKTKSTPFQQGQLHSMIKSLLQVIYFLHQKGIMHRDIKIQNILITQQLTFKLGDLGLAKYIKGDLDQTRVGTPIYFAPQMVLHKSYDQKIDIWALGCVCYYLAALKHPFQGAQLETLSNYILQSDPPPLKNYSPKINEIIFSMLTKQKQFRPSAKQLLQMLSIDRIPIQSQIKVYNSECLKDIKQQIQQRQDRYQDQLSPQIYVKKSNVRDLIDIISKKQFTAKPRSLSRTRNYKNLDGKNSPSKLQAKQILSRIKNNSLKQAVRYRRINTVNRRYGSVPKSEGFNEPVY